MCMDKISKKVYIVILNWNGWRDTIECLESVFHNSFHNYRVIVCDNASADNSLDKIKLWAKGQLNAGESNNKKISINTSPPVFKPIEFIEYNRKQAEQGGNIKDDVPLILIQTGANLGFAGGNNVGIRYALKRADFDYLWLLNNDTVIDRDALFYLMQKMQNDNAIGICGSTLLYYHSPDKIQALGGAKYNKVLGTSRHIGELLNYNLYKLEMLTKVKIDYIVGASMLISEKALLETGLLCEEYFLYYEEIDWATRMKNYKLAHAHQSIVYHKEGASIGSHADPMMKSRLSDYYSLKNRIIFTRKFYRWALPFVYAGLLIAMVNRIRRKQWDRIPMIVKIILTS